jgi:molybdopterin converting factor small subunit
MCRVIASSEVLVTIRFLSALRDRVGMGAETARLPHGSTLRTVSAHLAQHHALQVPANDVIATLNGRGWAQAAQGLDTPVKDGDVIHLFPPLAGG